MKTVIVVHGGAWAIPDELAEASMAGVKNAVRAGDTVLKNGGSALDAVEKAVRSLEDDPVFDAGTHIHTLPGPKKKNCFDLKSMTGSLWQCLLCF